MRATGCAACGPPSDSRQMPPRSKRDLHLCIRHAVCSDLIRLGGIVALGGAVVKLASTHSIVWADGCSGRNEHCTMPKWQFWKKQGTTDQPVEQYPEPVVASRARGFTPPPPRAASGIIARSGS